MLLPLVRVGLGLGGSFPSSPGTKTSGAQAAFFRLGVSLGLKARFSLGLEPALVLKLLSGDLELELLSMGR
jgi:hypothetical protein